MFDKPVGERTLKESERTVAAHKVERALGLAKGYVTAREIQATCGFRSSRQTTRVLGGLVRKGVAKTMPASCGVPRMWALVTEEKTP
jgi:hypothetical protein